MWPNKRADLGQGSCIVANRLREEQEDEQSGGWNETSRESVLDIFLEDKSADCLALVVAYLEHRVFHSEHTTFGKDARCTSGPFQNKCKPRISLRDYIHRIAKFTSASLPCFIMACSYIDRLSKDDENYCPRHQTVHRLILCGVLLAAKLTDDKFRSNAYYSKVGGVSMLVLNQMEVTMCTKLKFSLFLAQNKIVDQLRLMISATEFESTKIDDSLHRRSKKRISEDVGLDSEDDLPSKLPHGDQDKEVVVTQKPLSNIEERSSGESERSYFKVTQDNENLSEASEFSQMLVKECVRRDKENLRAVIDLKVQASKSCASELEPYEKIVNETQGIQAVELA